MPNDRKLIPFFGGPLDGHRQDVSQRKQELPTLLHLEISSNTYRILANQPPSPDAAATSLAIYELRRVNGADGYCFVEAKKPTQKPTADR